MGNTINYNLHLELLDATLSVRAWGDQELRVSEQEGWVLNLHLGRDTGSNMEMPRTTTMSKEATTIPIINKIHNTTATKIHTTNNNRNILTLPNHPSRYPRPQWQRGGPQIHTTRMPQATRLWTRTTPAPAHLKPTRQIHMEGTMMDSAQSDERLLLHLSNHTRGTTLVDQTTHTRIHTPVQHTTTVLPYTYLRLSTSHRIIRRKTCFDHLSHLHHRDRVVTG